MDAELALDPAGPDSFDSAFDRFVAAVLNEPELQARLGVLENPDEYVSVACAAATDLGIAISPDAIVHAIRPDPLGLSRFGAAPTTTDRWPGNGWVPGRSIATGGAPMIDWTWMGAQPLAAPFYEQDVRCSSYRPFSRMFRVRTTLAALVEGARHADAPMPDGLIFHMSRCGSTLVSQMLAAVPHHVVGSEVEPIDAVVQWAAASGAPMETQVAALRAIAGAVGRDRGGGARRFFLKLDSWHVLALPLFLAAFPATPWIFLYRDPIEVMVSQMRARGLQTIAGGLPPHVFGIATGEAITGERYCAEVLGRTCAAVLEHWRLGGGLLVNYADLPRAMAAAIPAHFGFTPDTGEAEAMAGAMERSAKAPHERFVADSARKQAAASDAIRRETGTHLAPRYAALEALRLGAGAGA